MIKVLYENDENGCISMIDFEDQEQAAKEIVNAMYSITATYLTDVLEKVDDGVKEITGKIIADQYIDALKNRLYKGIENNFSEDYQEISEEQLLEMGAQ